MLGNTLTKKTENLGVVHSPLIEVLIKGDEIKVGHEIFPLGPTGRNTIEHYVGFSAKFKRYVDPVLKDQVLNKVFQNTTRDVSLIFNGTDLVNLVTGTKELIPLDDVFNVVDNLIPDGELSLFKTTGLFTEFAVTTKDIQGAPTGSVLDITRGGVYLKAESLGKTTLTVIPILHRLSCANQMSKAEKDSALKVKGDSYFEVSLDLQETIQNYLDKTIPSNLNRWLGLADYKPSNPAKFATYLMTKGKIGERIQKKILDEVAYMNKPSAYHVINTITGHQHNTSEAQRNNLWRLGAMSLDVNESFECDTCHSALMS